MAFSLCKTVMLFSAFAVVGCTTQGLRVQSAPEGADVWVHLFGGSPLKVGKTPLELDARNTPGIFTESFQVQVSKEGYQPQSVLVPKLSTMGGTGRVNFNLEDAALPKVCQAQETSFNEMARGVAEVSNYIQTKRFTEASSLLQPLLAKFNSVAVLHDLQGNIHFLQKDLNRALDSYKKSNALSPNNPTTLRMIQRIQQLQGQPGQGV